MATWCAGGTDAKHAMGLQYLHGRAIEANLEVLVPTDVIRSSKLFQCWNLISYVSRKHHPQTRSVNTKKNIFPEVETVTTVENKSVVKKKKKSPLFAFNSHHTSNRVYSTVSGIFPSEYPTLTRVSMLPCPLAATLFPVELRTRSSSNSMSPGGKTAITVLPPYAK